MEKALDSVDILEIPIIQGGKRISSYFTDFRGHPRIFRITTFSNCDFRVNLMKNIEYVFISKYLFVLKVHGVFQVLSKQKLLLSTHISYPGRYYIS